MNFDSFSLFLLLIIADIVYRYGLIAGFIGNTDSVSVTSTSAVQVDRRIPVMFRHSHSKIIQESYTPSIKTSKLHTFILAGAVRCGISVPVLIGSLLSGFIVINKNYFKICR